MRLADVEPQLAAVLERMPDPRFEDVPWVVPPPLATARVALVSTAGLHRPDDTAFTRGSADYRVIADDVDAATLVMSHASVNFDRSAFQRDVDVVFPLHHLHALATAGEIGSTARWHYSFMGATDGSLLAESGREVGRLLRHDGVTAAVLVPV